MTKIYCIECLQTGEKYIGSTNSRLLSHRIATHKYRMNCSSSQILERGNYKYYLLEEVEVSQRYDREQYYMDITDKCINKHRAIGGFIRKEYNKEHYKFKTSWGGLLLIDTALFADK